MVLQYLEFTLHKISEQVYCFLTSQNQLVVSVVADFAIEFAIDDKFYETAQNISNSRNIVEVEIW